MLLFVIRLLCFGALMLSYFILKLFNMLVIMTVHLNLHTQAGYFKCLSSLLYNKIYANKRKIYIFTGSPAYLCCEGSLRTKITPNMLWKLTVDKLVCHTLTKFAHCKEDCAPAVMCIFSVFQISKDSL